MTDTTQYLVSIETTNDRPCRHWVTPIETDGQDPDDSESERALARATLDFGGPTGASCFLVRDQHGKLVTRSVP